MNPLEAQFSEHEKKDTARFTGISQTLTDIKENHLAHIESDMWWIKWLVMGLVAGIGVIFTGIVIIALTK